MHARAHSPKRRYCVLSLTRAVDASASRHYAPASSQERRTTVRPGAAERNNTQYQRRKKRALVRLDEHRRGPWPSQPLRVQRTERPNCDAMDTNSAAPKTC